MAHRKFAVVDNPSRVSCIFYVGLDGLGGLDMETEEDDHVGIHILGISQADINLVRELKTNLEFRAPLQNWMISRFDSLIVSIYDCQ
jgi:hypothetical protein